jgi:hypothetical protein
MAILDADKEGFLRSERALIQTMGRAARNINGHVILYGDRITNSMPVTGNNGKIPDSGDNIKSTCYRAQYNTVPCSWCILYCSKYVVSLYFHL